jgi:hypothetical protein
MRLSGARVAIEVVDIEEAAEKFIQSRPMAPPAVVVGAGAGAGAGAGWHPMEMGHAPRLPPPTAFAPQHGSAAPPGAPRLRDRVADAPPPPAPAVAVAPPAPRVGAAEVVAPPAVAVEDAVAAAIAALGDDWFGLSVRDEVSKMNNAIEDVGQQGNPNIADQLAVVGSPRYNEVVDALVRLNRMSRAEAERLVQRYTTASSRMLQRRREAENERQRALAEADDAEAKRLRERKPVVHCFGGCGRTAHYWAPCYTAPRQIGWVDKDGTNFQAV